MGKMVNIVMYGKQEKMHNIKMFLIVLSQHIGMLQFASPRWVMWQQML